MAKYEFKMPKRRQPVFRLAKGIFKLIYPCKKIVNLAGELPDKAIFVANHWAKSGPMALEIHLKKFNVKWGAHEMLEGYRARRKYLKEVFYMQKHGMGAKKAAFKATFEAIFSGMIYKGMKFLPTYPDARLARTIKYSSTVLDHNAAVLVFPEDSSKGYFEKPTAFFPGFVILAEKYFKMTGEDVPVIPVHYNKKHKTIVIGKPSYVQDYVAKGMDRFQIAEDFRGQVNGLYQTYVAKAE